VPRSRKIVLLLLRNSKDPKLSNKQGCRKTLSIELSMTSNFAF